MKDTIVLSLIDGTEGREFTLSTEFNMRNQAMLYVPKGMPDYRHPGYLKRAVEEIKNIARECNAMQLVKYCEMYEIWNLNSCKIKLFRDIIDIRAYLNILP